MCTMPLPIVLATAVPKTNAATKLKKAAQTTARKGVRTRVETTVAMELAASCQPFENSNARGTKTTMNRRVKLVIGRSGGFQGAAVGEEGVGNLVALVLDGFDNLHLLRHTGVVRQHFMQGVGPYMDIRCLFGEKVEETNFARQKPLQKSWHGI